MKKRKNSLLTRLAAAALAAILVAGTFSVTSAEAALKAPGNCRFVQWVGTNFTSCDIYWNQVSGAKGYQVMWGWTDLSHAAFSNYGAGTYGVRLSNLPVNHVSLVKVRAFTYNSKGARVYGPWSNYEYITPSPISVSGSIVSSKAVKNPQERLKWNIVYGSDGYNLFLTTNPYGTWVWNQSTAAKATATTAVVKKYRGANLKTYTNYYFRLVTRRRRNGVFCTVPMPSSSYSTGRFYFYKY